MDVCLSKFGVARPPSSTFRRNMADYLASVTALAFISIGFANATKVGLSADKAISWRGVHCVCRKLREVSWVVT
ncbi:hypothetical protein P154DRAFT_522031 [Amniculicola lignicola CBS 123094]|uniref:Uncharacterized protein n=1 Tax=Amniculicola lignicola CBS 123094 TaxID=1392246 RepID=A0A6A5WJQ8_9PLEO|nr:hypothetical protein P154DRAFT_522031 [Amniculicola lignicola CBS 123094]